MANNDSTPKKAAKATTKKAAPKAAAAKKPAAPKKPAATKKPAAKAAPRKSSKAAPLSPEQIAVEAYLIYLARLEQGQPGDSFSDWLAAEAALQAA